MINVEHLLRNTWPAKKYYLKGIKLEEKNNMLQHSLDTLNVLIIDCKNNLYAAEHKNKMLIDKNDNLSKSLNSMQKEIVERDYRIQQLESELGILDAKKTLVNSKMFWEEHYKKGGTSGTGSYSNLAEFKAQIVNEFILENNIQTVIEFGCGDGNQLLYMDFPNYVGIDVSETIVQKNLNVFSEDISKRFYTSECREMYMNQKYDLSLSMDVIYHLLEDNAYQEYMDDLFNASNKYVIIYSSNHEEYTKWPEYRHRNFMRYIQENQNNDWKLVKFIPNKYPYLIGYESSTSASDFYIFKRG